MLEKEQGLLIFYFISILLLFLVFGLVFLSAFIKRKNKLLLEKFETNKRFELEISTAQIEIQEQTLKNISWELHDNVGQLLSVINMQLNLIENKIPSELQTQIKETKELVATTVKEVRSISKTLNSDMVLKNGLLKSLELELERFKRLNFLKVNCSILGEVVDIKATDEIIIFRILQEFLSNVIRHAKAENLFVHLNFKPEYLKIEIKDDGVGFEIDQVQKSNGMQTMKSRSELLNASLTISSIVGSGTSIFLKYPYKHEW